MIDKRLKELASLRMRQAEDTLREARILHTERTDRGAVNRAYYAMFYAVLAILATEKLGSSKHSGAISLFDREFVKPGILPKEMSRSLHMAFEHRQEADYGELTELDESTATQMITEANTFIQSVRTYMTTRGFLSAE